MKDEETCYMLQTIYNPSNAMVLPPRERANRLKEEPTEPIDFPQYRI